MPTKASRVPELTPRERDVLVALCKPCLDRDTFTEPASIRTIADELGVTQAAVKQHLLKLYDKFRLPDDGERRRVRLANDAIALGVVKRGDDGGLAPVATDDGVPASIKTGRDACRSRSWDAAYRALAAADAAGKLHEVTDVEALGEAAWWSGHPQESIVARQRAYAVHVERGAHGPAAMVALDLAINYVTRLSMSVAGGWIAKARRHLEDQPERREHGHLAAIESLASLAQGDLETAMTRARDALGIGKRHGDRDVVAEAHTFEACVLARRGSLAEARALFDEAMASASSGELGPLATGIVYCRTICTCLDLFDFRRASEWTEAIDECRAAHGPDGFPGDCRAHKAAILAHRGQWSAAADEARTACTESATFDLAHTGLASYELGVAELRAGNLAAAERAFGRAHELGADPEPGMSMLRLARRDAAGAGAALREALKRAAGDPLKRARLLPVQVDVALATGDLDVATAATSDLAVIACDYDSSVLGAATAFAEGRLAAVSGDLDLAKTKLRDSHRLWLTVDSPHEAARARLELGRALAAQENDEAALLELRAAAAVFERLGARADLDAATTAIARSAR